MRSVTTMIMPMPASWTAASTSASPPAAMPRAMPVSTETWT